MTRKSRLDGKSELGSDECLARHQQEAVVQDPWAEPTIVTAAKDLVVDHLFNLNNRGLNIGSDGLCELSSRRKLTASAA